MPKCKVVIVKASRANCLRCWKGLRDSTGRIGIVRGPEDDVLTFHWFATDGQHVYCVTVLAEVFVLLLPKRERSGAIAMLKARRVRVDDTLLDAVLPTQKQAPDRAITRVSATRANCLAHWLRIKNGGVPVKLQRGVEDDAIGFGQLDREGALAGHVRVLVEDFIRLLPDTEREDAIDFFRRRGARFDAESARIGIDARPRRVGR
ncbi:MAG: hypothetical protein KA383_12570 [Phycisphaerae bacterium]|nr:hypothetical protein [Phycisphaerae bacterium]